jgi:hypothetical protein
MIYQENAAVDFNWVTLMIEGQPVKAKKHGFKVARSTSDVFRYGSNEVQAFTLGTVKVEDTTIEFDYMGAMTVKRIFGITDQNAATTALAGREFEMIEDVRDPRPVAGNAGGETNIAKGCEVVGVEWSVEAGEAATPMTWIVKIKKLEMARGAAGGGFTLGLPNAI